MIPWLIDWLTDGYCEYLAAYLLLTDSPDRMGALNTDMEDFYG